MSKKKIIAIFSLVAFGVANTVLYLIFKQDYLDVLKQGYDLINEPLPIVGVTASAVFIFLWQVFVRAKYGKSQINTIKNEYAEKNEAYQNKIETQDRLIKLQNAKITKLENHLIEACNTMPNRKVKAIGKKIEKESFYGEERIDSETKAD